MRVKKINTLFTFVCVAGLVFLVVILSRSKAPSDDKV